MHTCPFNPILLIKQIIPSLTGLAQSQLETVIPKSEGAFVLVVSGKYRGQVRNRSYLPLKAFYCIFIEISISDCTKYSLISLTIPQFLLFSLERWYQRTRRSQWLQCSCYRIETVWWTLTLIIYVNLWATFMNSLTIKKDSSSVNRNSSIQK